MEISTGTSRRAASANASSPQGHQSTGLSLCCNRYGEVASARRLVMYPTVAHGPRGTAPRSAARTGQAVTHRGEQRGGVERLLQQGGGRARRAMQQVTDVAR